MSDDIIIGPGDYQQDEREVAADTDPGHLVEFTGDRMQPHSSAPDLNGNGSAAPRFATEARDIGKGIDDTYGYDADNDEGERGRYGRPFPGSKVQAWLAAGESVSDGDPLESAGNGALQLHTGLDPAGDGTDTIADSLVVAEADESVDNSGGTDPVRIWVEI